MLDILKFIFSSPWIWLGFITFLYVVFEGVEAVVKAARRPKFTSKESQYNDEDDYK